MCDHCQCYTDSDDLEMTMTFTQGHTEMESRLHHRCRCSSEGEGHTHEDAMLSSEGHTHEDTMLCPHISTPSGRHIDLASSAIDEHKLISENSPSLHCHIPQLSDGCSQTSSFSHSLLTDIESLNASSYSLGSLKEEEIDKEHPGISQTLRRRGNLTSRHQNLPTRSVCLFTLATCLLCLTGSSQARPSSTEERVRKVHSDTVKYLAQFGYLSGPSRETQDLRSQEDLTRAIKSLQRAGNIPETGVPDRRTEALMHRPRCGNTDDFAHESSSGHFGDGVSLSRKRRYNLANSKWPRTNLTFRVRTCSLDMPADTCRRALKNALQVWENATRLRFTEIGHSETRTADIEIKFASRYHADGYPFDGPGMVLAHAFFPGHGKGGDTHFDEDENWSNGGKGGIDLFMVAAHEFGHALGLAHSGEPSALMYPWYMGVDGHFKLPQDDLRAITQLYGTSDRPITGLDLTPSKDDDFYPTEPPRRGDDEDKGPPDPCNTPIDAITVFRRDVFLFIGKYFWRLMDQKRLDQPKEIHEFWYGLPSNVTHIDALFERNDQKLVVFSGKRFWIFNTNFIARGFPKEGRPLTEYNIPPDVERIDASFVWSYNKRAYLVSGDMYWKMNENNTFVEYDYPRPMSTWDGVQVPLDAAFRDHSGKTIFFKGTDYWEFYDIKMRVRKGYPKRINHYFSWCQKSYNIKQSTNLSDNTVVETKLLGTQSQAKGAEALNNNKGNGCVLIYPNSLLLAIITLYYHLLF